MEKAALKDIVIFYVKFYIWFVSQMPLLRTAMNSSKVNDIH